MGGAVSHATSVLPKPWLAITGGPGTGKSTVLAALAERGFTTFSADEAATRLWNDATTQAALAEALGLPMPLDRTSVRARMLTSPSARAAIHAVLHPPIWRELCRSGADIAEVPLLFECCLQGAFARIWVVTCERREQIRRLEERFGDREQAEALISTQLPARVKAAFADRIVRTDEALSNVRRFVFAAIEEDRP